MEKGLKRRLALLACVSLSFALGACGDDAGGSSKKTCGGETCGDNQECREDKCVDLCGEVVCADTQICENDVCVDKPVDPCASCTEDQNCENNVCVDKPVDPCAKCTDGQRCINNECKDLCGESVCTDSQQCVADACKDLCGGVVCNDGQSCVEDACVDDDPCANKICDDGYRCNAGECVEIDPCEDVVCGEAQTCVKARCIDDACLEDGVEKTCDPGKVCSKGECVDDGCETVTCSEGWQCIKGICEETACLDVFCQEGRSCKGGTCHDNECLDVTCEGDMVCSKGVCTYEACLGKEPCVTGKTCDAEGICQFDVAPAVVIDELEDLESDENGDTVSLSVHLNNAPTQDVYITCAVETESPNKEVEVACGEIVFNADNWQTPQSVIITGVNDYLIDGDQKYKVVITTNSGDNDFQGLEATSVELTNLDRTVAGFVISDTTLTTYEDQEQDAAKFTIALSSIPSEAVTLTFASSNEAEGKLDKTSVSFTAENWNVPQEVLLKGVDDVVHDGNVEYAITFNLSESEDPHYKDLQPASIKVTNVDNDVAGFVVNNPEVFEIKETQDAVLTVKLNTKPKSDVTISVAVDDTTEAQPEAESVVLTSETWNTGAEVKINGLADHMIDGNQPVKITFTSSSEDTDYNTLEALVVNATVVDTDTAELVNTMSTAAIVKEGSADMVAMGLSLSSIPTSDVSVAISVSDPSELKVSKSAVTIKKDQWDFQQEINVSSVDDNLVDGDIKSKVVLKMTSSDENFNNKTKEVEFTTVDNDMAAFVISSNAASFPENSGSTTSMTVKLQAQPTADVKVAVASSDTTELDVTSSKNLTFTKDNWNTPQTVNVKVIDDNMADGTQTAYVKFTASSTDAKFNGITGQSAKYTIIDNEAPSVVLTASPLTIYQSSPTTTVSIVLGVQPATNVSVSLGASNPEVLSFSNSSVSFTTTNWNVPQKVTITANFEKVASASSTVSIIGMANGGVYAGIKSNQVTFNLIKVPEVQNFAYTGTIQSVSLPKGEYKLEAWGAESGRGSGSGISNNGGYATGNISLATTTTIYIGVGGRGESGVSSSVKNAAGGYNGGGNSYSHQSCNAGGAGGGATHFATKSGLLESLESNKASVLLVAGGAGGAGWQGQGGYGGGANMSGGNGGDGNGATVSSGFKFGKGQGGADGVCSGASSIHAGGGGGGYYGGYAKGTKTSDAGGGGGSGYASSTMTKISGANGNASMPAPAGSTETGHTGNGYARITLVK
ncbi:MAG: glycine-rich protein [Bradymonadia bacterium]